MTNIYDLEIVIRRRSAQPFRVTQVHTEERVREIIESFLAAWGIPAPDTLRDTGVSLFADHLADAGTYRHDEAGYQVAAKRAG